MDPATALPHLPVQRALSSSAARAAGIPRRELRGPLWRSPYRDVHLWTGLEEEHPWTRIVAAGGVLPPTGALGGWAAAWLLGARDVDGRGSAGLEVEPVPLVLPPPAQVRRRPGLVPVRSALGASDVVRRHGVRVTSPVRTAFDLARGAPGPARVVEAVAAVDALLRATCLPAEEVASHVADHPGWRGLPRARRVLGLADARARSRGETRLRLLWTVEAGLPPPEVNVDVLDAAGRFLGCVDLLDPATGLVAEYDGAGHREARQHAYDNAREERLEDAGLVVVRASSPDLGPDRRRTVHRLQSAHRRAGAQVRGSWRWRPSTSG